MHAPLRRQRAEDPAGRKPQSLPLVEHRVRKRREPPDSVVETRRQAVALDVQLLGEDGPHFRRQRAAHRKLFTACLPRLVRMLRFVSDAKDAAGSPRCGSDDQCEPLWFHAFDASQVRPLIRERDEVVVDEDAAAALPCGSLKRQRDQVAEAALRHHVLAREQPVIRGQTDARLARRRLRQDDGRKAPSVGRWDRCGEEDPNVRALAGARTLDCDGYAEFARRSADRPRIVTPTRAVEVDRAKPTCVVLEQWVDADDMTPTQMVEEHTAIQGLEGLIRTRAATHVRLAAHAGDPLVVTGRRVARPSRPAASPNAWEIHRDGPGRDR